MPSPELAQARFDSGRRNLDDAVMLPTPTASMATMQDMEQAKYAGNSGKRPAYRDALLPTPTATQYGSNRGGANPDGPERASLDTMARRGELLPTPTICGNYNKEDPSKARIDGLHTAVTKDTAPLSEQMGGLLSPEFVEKMMGWPANWTRTDGATGASGASLRPSASCPTAERASSASETDRCRSARPKRSDSLPAAEGGGE